MRYYIIVTSILWDGKINSHTSDKLSLYSWYHADPSSILLSLCWTIAIHPLIPQMHWFYRVCSLIVQRYSEGDTFSQDLLDWIFLMRVPAWILVEWLLQFSSFVICINKIIRLLSKRRNIRWLIEFQFDIIWDYFIKLVYQVNKSVN